MNLDPKKHCKGPNSVVSHILTTTDQELKFPKLDHSRLRLQVYSNASYVNNLDGSSQLGYIIFLADDNDKCQPLFWSSHKSKRVSRFILGSETIALDDAFEMAFAMKNDICVVQCACQAGTRVQRSSSNTNNNRKELPTRHSSTECPILPFPLSGFAAHSSSNP